MDKFLIGVSGKARNGKDVCSDELRSAMPRDADRYAFADPLKAYAAILGMKGKDGRLLQTLGQDVFRHLNPDLWVEVAQTMIPITLPRKVVVISDVRYPNEAQMVRDAGGILIRVRRLNADGSPYIATDRPATHGSETALDGWTDWDHVIEAQNVDELRSKARNLVPEILARVELFFQNTAAA